MTKPTVNVSKSIFKFNEEDQTIPGMLYSIKSIETVSSNININVYFVPSFRNEEFLKDFNRDVEKQYLYEIIDSREVNVKLINSDIQRTTSSGGKIKWSHKYRDGNYEVVVDQLETFGDIFDVSLSNLAFNKINNNWFKFVFKYELDEITYKFKDVESIKPSDPINGKYVVSMFSNWVCAGLHNVLISNSTTTEVIKEQSFTKVTHPIYGTFLVIFQDDDAKTQKQILELYDWQIDETPILESEVKAFNTVNDNIQYISTGYTDSIRYSIQMFTQVFNKVRVAYYISDSINNSFNHGTPQIFNALKNNVSAHIQYNHMGQNLFQIPKKYTPFQFIQNIADIDDETFANLILNQFGKKVDRSTNLNVPESSFIALKRPRNVPKNGEKFTGNRLMIFRRDIENVLMAFAVSKLYDAIVVPGENLGSRINNYALIPYIHTYNLFKDDCYSLAKKYSHCIYLDMSKYFETINYSLIEKAVNFFSQEEQSTTIKRCLSLIRKAMTALPNSTNHLTIDTNYEHALSTIVMAYITQSLNTNGVEYRTFVDDMVFYANSDERLDQLKHDLEFKCNELGLHLNIEKEKRFSGENYEIEMKALVFLPTGLRYRLDDSFSVELIKSIRTLGYSELLKTITKPVVNAFSDVQTFSKNFLYEEAKWVRDHYHNTMKIVDDLQDRMIRPTDENILDLLQYYTLNMHQLTGDDIQNLLIIMEEYPSKQKWIIRILMSDNVGQTNAALELLKDHKSEFVRYLLSRKFTNAEHVVVPVGYQTVNISSDEDYTAALNIFKTHGYRTNVEFVPDSLESWKFLNSMNYAKITKHVYIRYSVKAKMFIIINGDYVTPQSDELMMEPKPYPFKYWKWLVENSVNPFDDGRRSII